MLAMPSLIATCAVASAQVDAHTIDAYTIEGDSIEERLGGEGGDPARGATLMANRQKSLCVLCHSGPFTEPHLQGTLAPSLAGVGGRLSAGQIRLRIVDMKALDPDTTMPAYYRTDADDARRVASAWRGKPILAAGEIEDLVAYLVTLKD